jgi:hypothetical protein
MRSLRLCIAACMAISGLMVTAGTASARDDESYTCHGGPTVPGTAIPPGNYESILVTGGICFLPGGVVNVKGNVAIAPGATLLANFPSPASNIPEGDATLIVGGDVSVARDGTLVLGCSPALGCQNTTNSRIKGDLRADRALGLLLHSDRIAGDVSMRGGGGGVTCTPSGFFAQIGSPVYTTFEDNTIGGNANVSGLQSCWFGFIRNQVEGTVNVHNNTFADEDATEIVTNTIEGNLICQHNDPAAQFGDSGGIPNTVEGKKLGECATL